MSEGLNARLCALNALQSVFEGGKALDMSLDKQAEKLKLSRQDKSFAHALCGFVLRYKPALQSRINAAADRARDITPSSLNTLLLIGAAQIYLMAVPDHAAVNTSVDLTYKIKCSKQKGLVNAVLRRLIREGERDLEPSLPDWLVQTWINDYGRDTARAIEIASLMEARVAVTFRHCEEAIADEAIHKISQSHGLLPPNQVGGRNDEKRDIEDIAGYKDGSWWIQDFASHYPVSLLPDLTGKTVLDLCAAPGGKTMQLAAKNANVVAVDISEKRLKRLQENLERTKMTEKVEVVCADLMKWAPDQKADYILLDAPCSATGTIRRHPDLPYIRTKKDIAALVKLQSQLLDRVKDWLTPDGVMVYCTCSLQMDEGERQIATFLHNNPDFERDDRFRADDKFINDNGDIRLLPSYGDMDGFFVSYLKWSKP